MRLLSVVQMKEKDYSGTLKVLKQIKKEIRSKKSEVVRELQKAMMTQDRTKRIYYEGRMADLGSVEGIIDNYIARFE